MLEKGGSSSVSGADPKAFFTPAGAINIVLDLGGYSTKKIGESFLILQCFSRPFSIYLIFVTHRRKIRRNRQEKQKKNRHSSLATYHWRRRRRRGKYQFTIESEVEYVAFQKNHRYCHAKNTSSNFLPVNFLCESLSLSLSLSLSWLALSFSEKEGEKKRKSGENGWSFFLRRRRRRRRRRRPVSLGRPVRREGKESRGFFCSKVGGGDKDSPKMEIDPKPSIYSLQ